jgi:hypothetical protein
MPALLLQAADIKWSKTWWRLLPINTFKLTLMPASLGWNYCRAVDNLQKITIYTKMLMV